jgi:hypothetical protein
VPVERIADALVHLAEQSIGDELAALDAANRRARIADYSDLFAAPVRASGAEGLRQSLRVEQRALGAAELAAAEQLATVEKALTWARDEAAEGAAAFADNGAAKTANAANAAIAERAQTAEATQRNAALPGALPQKSQASSASRPTTPRATPPRRHAEPYAMPLRNKEHE